MNNWTIKQRIMANSTILCLVIVGLSVFSICGIQSLQKLGISLSDDSIPGTILAQRIRMGRVQTQVYLQALALAKTPQEIQSLKEQSLASSAGVEAALKDYEATIFAAEDRALFTAVKTAREAYTGPKQQFLDTVATDREGAIKILTEKIDPLADACDKTADAMLTYNTDQAAKRGSSLKVLVRALVNWIVGVGIVAVATGIVLSIVNIRSIARTLMAISQSLNDGASQVAEASTQISGSSQSLAEGASEQAASLEETSASIEEIGSMTKRNSESAETAQALSSRTRGAAEEGAARTEEMQEAMGAIQAASAEMGSAIADIKASSDNVSKIIKTIDEIAFQTNILALNAAVEAARAGEAGMGFAVVAEEVRNLAQRSATAAKETAQMIEASVAQSSRGVEVNGKVTAQIEAIGQKSRAVRDSLTEIVTKAREVDTLVATIATASKEQSSGLQQITVAMTQMDQVTQTNAAGAEEAASAAEELNAQSAELRSSVESLVRLVDGEKGLAHSASATSAAIPFGRDEAPAPRRPMPKLQAAKLSPVRARNGKTQAAGSFVNI